MKFVQTFAHVLAIGAVGHIVAKRSSSKDQFSMDGLGESLTASLTSSSQAVDKVYEDFSGYARGENLKAKIAKGYGDVTSWFTSEEPPAEDLSAKDLPAGDSATEEPSVLSNDVK